MTNIAEIRKAQALEVFAVNADAETGEWIGEPESTGDVTTAHEWAKREDTDEEHFDTYVYDDEAQSERAIIVKWV